jgi:hypothetical protein
MRVNQFRIWPLGKLGLGVPYMNPKYYGLNIYLSWLRWDRPETPSKKPLNCRKLNFHFWWLFFLKLFLCSNRVIYQSIGLDLLYKTVYMTFPLNLDFTVKKSKNGDFWHIEFRVFFSILTEYLGQKSIAKRTFTSSCRPFNSASNHILDIVSQRSAAEIIWLEHWRLTPYLSYYWCHNIHIWNFFSWIFSLSKLNRIPIDRAWLALQNGLYDISSQPQYWSQIVKILHFLTSH